MGNQRETVPKTPQYLGQKGKNMRYRLNTISDVRRDFWATYPCFQDQYKRGKRQNDYNATIRSYFVGFVDCLAKSGDISESLADRATL